MRDLFFAGLMVGLLPLVVARPFVGVILWSWLSFMNPHQIVWGFAGGIPWAQLIFVVTVVGCIMSGEPRRLPMNGVTSLLLALLAGVTLTSAAAVAPPALVWDYWERVFKIILGLMLTASLVTDRWRLHALIWVMVISIGFFGVRGGLFTIATGGSFMVLGPPNSMISDRNHIGVGLLVALPLMNYLRMQSRHRIVQLGLWAAMGLTLLGAIGTQSRGALLTVAALTAFLWFRSNRKLVSGIVLAIALAGVLAFMPDSWWARMSTIQSYEQDQSAFDRTVLWVTAFRLALDRPLVGTGFRGPYTREVVDRIDIDAPARATHSIYFEPIGEHGFIVFGIWLALTLTGFFYAWRLIRMAKGRPELAWAGDLGRMGQVSIIAYLVGGTFLSLAYWDYYWTILVALAAAYKLATGPAQGWRGAAARVASADGWRPRSAPVGGAIAAGPAAAPRARQGAAP